MMCCNTGNGLNIHVVIVQDIFVEADCICHVIQTLVARRYIFNCKFYKTVVEKFENVIDKPFLPVIALAKKRWDLKKLI